MKYAHFADLHLGSWREDKMRQLSMNAFLTAIDECINEKVDFILFSGDMFNTSLPSLDTLKVVTKKMKDLSDMGIPIYAIAGSHDFSPSGKTMLDVLENAGLLVNVCKGKVDSESRKLFLRFTIDTKTGVRITGIVGRKGMLDRTYYENLDLENLENEKGYKIFLFHTALTELKPKHLEFMEAYPATFLPKGFDYYAGGHVHHPARVDIENYGPMTYPGALFPNNFAELEKYSKGGYYLVTVDDEGRQEIAWCPVEVMKHRSLVLDCIHKTPEIVLFEVLNAFNNQDLSDTLITLRLIGTLEKGRVADIDFKQIFEKLSLQGSYFVMKNTAKLNSEEFEEIKINPSNPDNLEEEVISEHLQQSHLFDATRERELIRLLLGALNTSKREGETITDFQLRIETEMNRLLHL
jgi:DNA repair exonuclease SbcCD nuclease subunit